MRQFTKLHKRKKPKPKSFEHQMQKLMVLLRDRKGIYMYTLKVVHYYEQCKKFIDIITEPSFRYSLQRKE